MTLTATDATTGTSLFPDEPTAEGREVTCAGCHQVITLLGGDWTDPDGCTCCYADPAPSYTPHKPASKSPALDWLRANTELLTGPMDDIDGPAVIDLTTDEQADYEDWGSDSDE